MDLQQQSELLALIEANTKQFYLDPKNFVPFGTEYLCERDETIFEAQMDRVYRRHEIESLTDEVYQDGTYFCD